MTSSRRRAAHLRRREGRRRGQGEGGQREDADAEGSYHRGLLKDQDSKLRRILRNCRISTGFYFDVASACRSVRPDGRREDRVGERGRARARARSRPTSASGRPGDQRPVRGRRGPPGRKCSPATRLNPSTIPAISFSDHPIEPRIRLTTTRTGHARRRGRAGRPARGPAGPARPGPPRRPRPPRRRASRAARVRALRPGRPPKSDPASSSRLKPVSTTTWPSVAGPLEQLVDLGGAHLAPPVGPGQPGDHGQVLADARGRPRRSARRAGPTPASRDAESSPETSSRMPSCWATDPP